VIELDQNDVSSWVTLLIQVLGLAAVSIGALWAYLRYVLERGIFPPAQLDVEVVTVGSLADTTLLEVLVHLENLGSSTLIVRNVRVDIRYLCGDDDAEIFQDASDPRFGRVNFSHSLRADIDEVSPVGSESTGPDGTSTSHSLGNGPEAKGIGQGRGFQLVRHDTFVQAGITQTYTFVTKVPEASRYVLAFASFEYAQRLRRIQRIANRLGRGLGLIQFSLHHVREPHTAERVFTVGPVSRKNGGPFR
jgi:hypothetical protein